MKLSFENAFSHNELIILFTTGSWFSWSNLVGLLIVIRSLRVCYLRQEDKAKVRNVNVIPNEECVPKHKLLVMDMQIAD